MNRMLAVVLTLALVTGCAAEKKTLAPTTAPAGHAAQSDAKADAIQAGDLLHIYIPDLTGPGRLTHKPMRVDESGIVSLPYVGTMRLSGLSLREAESAIDESYNRFGLQGRGKVSLDREESGRQPSIKPGAIAAGDVVRVQVLDLLGQGVWTTLLLHVSPAGEIGLVHLGQLRVAGLTELQAEKAIAEAYAQADILRNPQVNVLRIAPEHTDRWRLHSTDSN
jgi:protein involved in polysaccharide export with SLBB domain